jgi:hypothetical protein
MPAGRSVHAALRPEVRPHRRSDRSALASQGVAVGRSDRSVRARRDDVGRSGHWGREPPVGAAVEAAHSERVRAELVRSLRLPSCPAWARERLDRLGHWTGARRADEAAEAPPFRLRAPVPQSALSRGAVHESAFPTSQRALQVAAPQPEVKQVLRSHRSGLRLAPRQSRIARTRSSHVTPHILQKGRLTRTGCRLFQAAAMNAAVANSARA